LNRLKGERYLVIVDAIRGGRALERELAVNELKTRIR
jgi:hypothetical protein